ncbi:MAG TPA: NfeD family protein [Actinomycetota bacterium]|nr:NfeD family protein [Actinomycetota bacterium]
MLLIIGGTLALIYLPPPWSVLVIGVLLLKEVVEISLWVSMRRRRPSSGAEGLVGRQGELIQSDRVRIAGTSYPARVLDGKPGDRVVVERVDGMTLSVRRAD